MNLYFTITPSCITSKPVDGKIIYCFWCHKSQVEKYIDRVDFHEKKGDLIGFFGSPSENFTTKIGIKTVSVIKGKTYVDDVKIFTKVIKGLKTTLCQGFVCVYLSADQVKELESLVTVTHDSSGSYITCSAGLNVTAYGNEKIIEYTPEGNILSIKNT